MAEQAEGQKSQTPTHRMVSSDWISKEDADTDAADGMNNCYVSRILFGKGQNFLHFLTLAPNAHSSQVDAGVII